MLALLAQSFSYFLDGLASPEFLLLVKIVSCVLHITLCIGTIILGIRSTSSRKLWPILAAILGCLSFVNIAWVIKLLRVTGIFPIDSAFMKFCTNMSHSSSIAFYSLVVLFIERLIDKENIPTLKKHHILFLVFFLLFGLFFIYMAIPYPLHLVAYSFEFRIKQLAYLYHFCLILFSLWVGLASIKNNQLPKILAHQLKTFLVFLLIPHFVLDLIAVNPFTLQGGSSVSVSVATIFLTYALCFCVQRLFRLRFLNFNKHVQVNSQFDVIRHVQTALNEFSQATMMHEIIGTTKNFFTNAFGIAPDKTKVVVLYDDDNQTLFQEEHTDERIVEQFLTTQTTNESSLLAQTKIFIADEMKFNHFYEPTPGVHAALLFMQKLSATIFLPLYEQKMIIGYIIIKDHARDGGYFGEREKDEMLVFANHVSAVVNFLRSRNLSYIGQENKELKDELYLNRQRIKRCQEIMQELLRDKQIPCMPGVIMARRRRFISADEDAEDMLGIKIQQFKKHPILDQLLTLSTKAIEYKEKVSITVHNAKSEQLLVVAVPCDAATALITLYRSAKLQEIKLHTGLLKDSSKWDYLLDLQLTPSGQLIDQLIPGTGESIINFKVNLLETALSKKAILITMEKDDLAAAVEIVHNLSLRSTFFPIKLSAYERNREVGIKLFGLSSIYGMPHQAEPIVQKLDKIGTLYIENVEFLALETQDKLALFIKESAFRPLGSSDSVKKISSDVRIICSTQEDLAILVKEGRFSAPLFNELKKMMANLPSLLTLPHAELINIVEAVEQQVLVNKQNKPKLSMVDRDKIINFRPASFQEFRDKLHLFLDAQAKKKVISVDPIEVTPLTHITDPELLQAARLGKHALKDKGLMTMLWHKMKSQAKIAQLLNVNRSTVNRRCKMYNLMPPQTV